MRRGLLACVVLSAWCSFACGDPPDKEMQQAQGAIDAARAAGADAYARDEVAAAQDSLKKAQDAVAQRDYRLALTYALDSRERAQNAAKEAGDNKASARSDAERALTSISAAVAELTAKIKAIESARPSAKGLVDARQAIADAETAVQKARTEIAGGEFLAAVDELKPLRPRLQGVTRDLEGPTAPPARRRR